MICKRVARMAMPTLTVLLLTVAACGTTGGDDAAAPAADGGAANAPAAENDAAGGDAPGGGEVGAGESVTDSSAVGMISSGTADRPTDSPLPERPEQQVSSKRVKREELLTSATMPLFELPSESPDDQFSYHWVTARDGDGDPTLPQARTIVTLNFAKVFTLTQWAVKEGAEMTEEGEATDVTVGGAPAKLWTLREQHVLTWDNGGTRLRMKTTTFTKDELLDLASKLVPMR